MTSKIISAAYIFLLIVASGISFFVLRDYDEQTVIGATTSFLVSGPVEKTKASSILNDLESLSQKSDTTVVKLEADINGSKRSRILYVTQSSATGRGWLAKGYPSFSRDKVTTVRSFSAASANDPRGVYLIIGDDSSAATAETILRNTGASVETYKEQSIARFIAFYFLNGSLLWLLLISALCASTILIAGTVVDAKRYAVMQVHGWNKISSFIKDLSGVARVLLPTGLVIATVGYLSLLFYNNAHHYFVYLSLWIIVSLVATFLLAFVHLASIWAVAQKDILKVMRGGLKPGALMALLRAVQLSSILITIMVASQLGQLAAQLTQIRESAEDWNRYGSLAVTSIRVAQQSDEGMRELVGNYGNQERKAGRALLAIPSDPQASGVAISKGFLGARVLIVDENYLKFLGLKETSPLNDQKTSIRALVPTSIQASSSEVESVIRPLLPLNDGVIDVTPITVKPLQQDSVVTFGSIPPLGAVAESSARYSKTILVVLPQDSKSLTDKEVSAMMSNGALLFMDQQRVIKDIQNSPVLSKYISDVKPITSIAAIKQESLSRQLSLLTASLIISILTLIIFSIANTLVYIKANSQRLRIQTVSGWSFWMMHWKMLLFDLLIVLAVVGSQIAQQQQLLDTLSRTTTTGMDYFHAALNRNEWAVPGTVLIAVCMMLSELLALKIVIGHFIKGKSVTAI